MSDIRLLCGFCDLLGGLLRRVMCSRICRRRGSSDTCYRELDEQDTLRSDGRQHSNDSITSGELNRDNAPVLCEPPLPKNRPLFHSFKERPKRQLPEALENIYPRQVEVLLSKSSTWNFDTDALDIASGGHCLSVLGMHIFEAHDLLKTFDLIPEKCLKLFQSIEENYHVQNPYHNAVHAADVTQAVHCFLKEPLLSENMTKMEVMVTLLAAMTHDLDHPGVNFEFLLSTQHTLAIMYKDYVVVDEVPQLEQTGKKRRTFASSPMKTRSGSNQASPKSMQETHNHLQCFLEEHHFRMAFSTILVSGVFAHMEDEIPKIRKMLRSLILATDITRQDHMNLFRGHLKRKTLNWTRADHRLLVLQMALKTADISNPGRPWFISNKWSNKVVQEFFAQGDEQRALCLNISKLCDRNKETISQIQINFIRLVVAPLYIEWNNLLVSNLTNAMLKNLVHNEAEWRREDLQPGCHPTTISDIYYSEADLVEYSLGTSTNISGSVELLFPFTPVRGFADGRLWYSGQSIRRSSYSSIRRPSSLKEAIRRLSAPLDYFWEAPSLIKKDRSPTPQKTPTPTHQNTPSPAQQKTPLPTPPHTLLNEPIPENKQYEEEQVKTAQGFASDEHTSSEVANKMPKLKDTNAFGRVVTIITERTRRLANRTRAQKSVSSESNSSSSNTEKNIKEPTRPYQCSKFDTGVLDDSHEEGDDEASSEKLKTRLKSFLLTEDSSSSSLSPMTSSSIPISGTARLLPSNTLSALSSESRLFLPLQFDVTAAKKVTTSCEMLVGLEPSGPAKEMLVKRLAMRRGSAPAPTAVSELQRLASNLSLHQLGARVKHSASCHQAIAAKQAPVMRRRGSLPVEVITGSFISAV